MKTSNTHNDITPLSPPIPFRGPWILPLSPDTTITSFSNRTHNVILPLQTCSKPLFRFILLTDLMLYMLSLSVSVSPTAKWYVLWDWKLKSLREVKLEANPQKKREDFDSKIFSDMCGYTCKFFLSGHPRKVSTFSFKLFRFPRIICHLGENKQAGFSMRNIKIVS